MAEHEEHHEEHGGEGEEHGKHKKGGHGHGPGGHGGHEEHAGAPEWLISFADNVALLMGFFVILLAMNMGPKGGGAAEGKAADAGSNNAQMMDFIYGMRQAFNNPPDPKSPDPRERELAKWAAERDKNKTNYKDTPDGKFDKSQSIPEGQKLKPTGVIVFETDSSGIGGSNVRIIKDVAEKIRGQNWVIEVRGHVSAIEAQRASERAAAATGTSGNALAQASAGDVAAYMLSYQRAVAVTNALIREGIDKKRLRVVACADHERQEKRAYDATQHRTNQRVEIIVTDDPAPKDQYLNDPGTGRR